MPFDHEDDFDLVPAVPETSPESDLDQGFTAQTIGAGVENAEQPAIELPLKYLHTISLVFDLIAHVRSYLFPLGFGVVGAANGSIRLLIISAILFIPAVLRSIFRYFTLRYRIEDAHFYVDQGLIFRTTRTIPVDRIQNIDLTQNVLHRIFNVAEVKVETASGTEAEAVLRVLSMEEVDTLRKAIFAGKQLLTAKQTQKLPTESADAKSEFVESLSPVSQASDIAHANDPADVEEVWKIPFVDLVKVGLASNRGLVMLGVGLVTFDQFNKNGYETVFAFLTDYFPKDTSSQGFYLQVIAAAVLGFVLLRLVGIVWYVLRFYDYKLQQRGDDLRLSCGLLTRVSATVPRKRIQFVSVQQNLIMRWFGIATIRIETAGGATDASKPNQSIGKTWFMPVIPVSEVPQLVNLLRPGVDWDLERFDFQGLAPRAPNRLVRIALGQTLLCAIAVVGVEYYFSRTFEVQALVWGGVAGLAAMPALILFALKKAASRKYARIENGVVYRTGVFRRKTSVTFFDKLQTVACFQTPFDRRWQMATLAIDTAAAGPAGHRIVTPYLDADFASSELKALRCFAVEAAS